MVKVCIVYEVVPEETQIYVIEMEGEDVERAKRAHKTYGNTNLANEDTDWLANLLLKHKQYEGIPTSIDMVISSGFVL